MKPTPKGEVKLVAAGQSPVGMAFAATYCDYNFILGSGCNTPTAHAELNQQLVDAVAKTGRDVGAYVLFMVIADETDEAAQAKWKKYKDGVDVEALAWMADQGAQDKIGRRKLHRERRSISPNRRSISTWARWSAPTRMSRECSTKRRPLPGTKGIMLTFDDFVVGMEDLRLAHSTADVVSRGPPEVGGLTRPGVQLLGSRGDGQADSLAMSRAGTCMP